MSKQWGCRFLLIIFSGVILGCASPPFYSYLVYENPTAFVRLEFSPWADMNQPQTWNAHPASLSRRQIQKALEGLRVREHRAAPLRWIMGVAPMEPAFHKEEIEWLIPQLLEGLELAVPQEIVTFYLSHPVNATKREVTSGGFYVTEGQLHIILSNYRAVYGIPPAGLIYDRRFPLFSLAPLGVDILYETEEEELVRAKEEDLFDAVFGDERSGEIVLNLSQLSMMKM
jgi:hypothetical protein